MTATPQDKAIHAFYNPARWGEQFGTKDALHPHGKTGMDVEWGAETKIVTPVDIYIVLNELSSTLGWCSEGLIMDGPWKNHYIAFRHMNARPFGPVGSEIKAGNWVGSIAGPGGTHGSQWTGPHLDLSVGHTARVWEGLDVENPAGFLKLVLAATPA